MKIVMKDEKTKVDHSEHRKRLRKKACKDVTILEDHELVEVLLYGPIPYKDTNPVAHELLKDFGSLTNLLNAGFDSLYPRAHMTENAAIMFPVIKELARRVKIEESRPLKKVENSKDAYETVKNIFGKNYAEQLVMVCLDEADRVIYNNVLADGDIHSLEVPVSVIAAKALALHSHKVLLAHNHPSGAAAASEQDTVVTKQLARGLSALGITLIDHLIVTRGGYFSLNKEIRVELNELKDNCGQKVSDIIKGYE